MKRNYRITVVLAALWVVAVIAYFWATGIIDSLYSYRSPLMEHAPEAGQPLGDPVTRRIVFVLIDGLRVDTSMKSGVMPYLNELREIGAWGTMHSRPPSYSTPGYSVLFTGAWPEINDGPVMNLEYENIPTWSQDNLVSAVNRAGMQTALSGYYWFEKLAPQDAVGASFYTSGEDQYADREVVDAALPWILQDEFSFIFVHLDQVDHAGHYEGGPHDPNWDAAARRSDDLLREIASGLDFELDTLFVSSDHGHIDRGGHGGHDRVTLMEPYVMVGAGVKPGEYADIQMVDVAPTLAAMLGANIPAANQGHVLVDMVDFKPAQLNTIASALELQQGQLLEAIRAGTGFRIPVEEGPDIVDTHQAGLEASYRNRANSEKLIRVLPALVLAFLPALILYRKRGHSLSIMLAAAVAFVVLFNLRYAVLDGFTYSLSSVTGANALVLYTGVTTAVGLVLVWLGGMAALKSFEKGPAHAVEMSLALVWVIIYILMLPVLVNFSMNGLFVGWRLPDFASSFLGFLSLIQILFVGLLGPLLAGLAAMAATWYIKKLQGRDQKPGEQTI